METEHVAASHQQKSSVRPETGLLHLVQPPVPPERSRSSDILFLQATLGNRTVARLLRHSEATVAAAPGAPLSSDTVQRGEDIASAPAGESYEYPGRLLRLGSRGDDVRTAQTLLNRHGAALSEDGIYGPLTHQAVLGFQQANALTVDGIIGPKTWAALSGRSTVQPGEPPAGQPGGLSPADIQALASALMEAGTDLLVREPMVGAQVLPVLKSVADELLSGSLPTPTPSPMPTAVAEGTVHRAIMRSVVGPTVMRQVAPPAPQQASPDLARKQALQEVKRAFVRIHDLIVNDLGQKPVVGPAGGPGDPVRTQVVSLDTVHRYFSQLLAQPWPQVLDPITAAARQELELFLHRTAALRSFYNSVLPPQAALPGEPGDMPTQARPTDARRLQIVGNGLADLGKVRAKDTDGEGRRVGHDHLKVIFDTAWPTHVRDGVPDSLIERRKLGKKLKHGGDPTNPADFIHGVDLLPSWCGVGATYWAKKADSSFPNWTIGIGVVQHLRQRTRRELPEVGDLAVAINQGHHGIITWVDPGAKLPASDTEWGKIQIRTVEANIGGEIVETPSGHGVLSYWTVGVFKPFDRK